MADYKRANYLRREAELAHRNAKAADTLGRYAEAAWWEERGRQLIEELKNGQQEDSDINV